MYVKEFIHPRTVQQSLMSDDYTRRVSALFSLQKLFISQFFLKSRSHHMVHLSSSQLLQDLSLFPLFQFLDKCVATQRVAVSFLTSAKIEMLNTSKFLCSVHCGNCDTALEMLSNVL